MIDLEYINLKLAPKSTIRINKKIDRNVKLNHVNNLTDIKSIKND